MDWGKIVFNKHRLAQACEWLEGAGIQNQGEAGHMQELMLHMPGCMFSRCRQRSEHVSPLLLLPQRLDNLLHASSDCLPLAGLFAKFEHLKSRRRQGWCHLIAKVIDAACAQPAPRLTHLLAQLLICQGLGNDTDKAGLRVKACRVTACAEVPGPCSCRLTFSA